MFLDRKHIEKIVDNLPDTEEEWISMTKSVAWDSLIQSWTSNKYFAIPDKSYVEHYGLGGQNHKTKNSDLALEPTPFLKETSKNIWNILEKL